MIREEISYNNINLNATKGDINITADTSTSDSFARSFGIGAGVSGRTGGSSGSEIKGNGKITILFDPSGKETSVEYFTNLLGSEKWGGRIGGFTGLLSDLGEVGINYAGANILGGLIQTKGQATDEQFITAVTNNAKESGIEITLAGHSGGGLRNYLALANSSQNQYLDANGNSILSVQYSGTPVSYLDMFAIGNYTGVGELRWQNNNGDFVGNVLGMNGDVVEGGFSSYSIWKLFGNESPHSNYNCILSNCYSGQLTNPIPKPN